MGIKGLTKVLREKAPDAVTERKVEEYSGRRIAVDASTCIYQFLIVVGRRGTDTLTNDAGEVTSHLQGMFARAVGLLDSGVMPVFVFDGSPPYLKMREIAKRSLRRNDAHEDLALAIQSGRKDDIEKFSKRTVKVTRQHNEDCKKLLRLLGLPVLEAPSEAEAQCASLCISGKVYGVASEDMDSLTFGAPRLLRQMMVPSSRKSEVLEFKLSKILEQMSLDMDQFIDFCLLCGCDYCDGIRGVGVQTALKLIRQHGSIDIILEKINKDRYSVPDEWSYKEARQFFKEPPVFNPDEEPELKWIAPNEEGLITFLVKENGFNINRVKKALEKVKTAERRLIDDIPNPYRKSGAAREKEGTCVLQSPRHVTTPKMLLCGAHKTLQPKVFGNVCISSIDLALMNSRIRQPCRGLSVGLWS
ncbi:hypothetical protein MLD38_017792 [Melastoma candidum]|uniref:Uncharacterized protein n=1 Tax=Melastoma candidum TaxID=119954 RepID=A0ACB9QRZ1_9MYRT|nr:hypothetical protein MLD38_017792 [Melastoma candidum]